MKRIACGVLVGLFAVFDSLPAEACFAGGAVPRDLIRDADVIVRVRAVDTSTEPAMSPLVTTVRFLILEQLKGEERLFDLAVRGSFASRSDFNDRPVPYFSALPKPTSVAASF